MPKVVDIEHRLDVLWTRYHKNGNRLSKSEVKNLLGISYYSAYTLFKKHGVKAPKTERTPRIAECVPSSSREVKDTFYERHPDGLTVLSSRKLVDGRTIYLLR